MPIIIKDINWEETETNLVLHIPMKGVKATNVDVLSSDRYFKISFPPFFYEVFLHDFIDDDQTRVVVKNGLIEVTLTKMTTKKWNQLSSTDADDKETMKKLREEAVEKISTKQKQRAEAKSTLLNENKRQAIREQMKIEEDERNRIDSIKNAERDKMNDEMKKFEENQKIQRRVAIEQHVETPVRPPTEEKRPSTTIFPVEEPKVAAPLRQSGRIAVNFTARVFPTPLRESQNEIEEEWLRKQYESRQASNELQLDLSDKDKDVDYLKSKANLFFEQGDFQSAIGVYNHAIRVFPKLPMFYLNRSVCHFQVRNLMKCVEDCSRALELLNPPVPDNLSQRIKAHVRRGTAFCELELYAEGLLDYEAAQKLSPNDEQIREDAQRIRNYLEKNRDFD